MWQRDTADQIYRVVAPVGSRVLLLDQMSSEPEKAEMTRKSVAARLRHDIHTPPKVPVQEWMTGAVPHDARLIPLEQPTNEPLHSTQFGSCC